MVLDIYEIYYPIDMVLIFTKNIKLSNFYCNVVVIFLTNKNYYIYKAYNRVYDFCDR